MLSFHFSCKSQACCFCFKILYSIDKVVDIKDIKDFYPSIKEKLLQEATTFAKHHICITNKDIAAICHLTGWPLLLETPGM